MNQTEYLSFLATMQFWLGFLIGICIAFVLTREYNDRV